MYEISMVKPAEYKIHYSNFTKFAFETDSF